MREGQELEQAEALRRTHMHVTSVSTAGKELQQATISKAQSLRAQDALDVKQVTQPMPFPGPQQQHQVSSHVPLSPCVCAYRNTVTYTSFSSS